MKVRILKDMEKPKFIRLDHWLNMVEHTRGSNNIEQKNVMREFKKCVKNVSIVGRSDSKVCRIILLTIYIDEGVIIEIIANKLSHG